MLAENFDLEVAELWDAASNKLRDRKKYVDSLQALLRDNGITERSMIIDVAGGFGFPAIDLAKRGMQICYMDGSLGMLERAMLNAELQGAPAYIFSFQSIGYNAVPWQALEGSVGSESFDALICTGNSLPYAVSWGKGNPNLSNSREQIVSALNHFHRILKPNGVMFVDKQPEAQEHCVMEIGEVDLNGDKYLLTTNSNNDKKARIRNWTLKTKNVLTNEEREYPSRGYLLLEDELLPLLRCAGFRDIEKHILQGDVYEGFLARK